jgi:hypothetical protein
MLKWLIRKRISAFERTYEYDMSYVRELLATDTSAFFAFAKIQAMSNYRRDVSRAVLAAAGLIGTIAEDCGPCTQLGITMALREGVDPKVLSAIVRGDEAAMPDDVRLGYRFAKATLAHDPAADELREQIRRTWGPCAVISLAFTLTLSRVYPTLKYALGHGKTCQRVVVAGTPVSVLRATA